MAKRRENGDIASGDPITTSSKPGYAMKATQPGPIIGYAMESFSGTVGSVITFIRPGYYDGAATSGAPAADNIASGDLQNASNFSTTSSSDLYSGNVLNVIALRSLLGNWSLEENGDFITKGRITHVVESYQGDDVETYAVTSRETSIQLSGTAQLQDGRAHVLFDEIDESFKNIISNTFEYRVLVTASAPSGQLYISQKESDGFIIRENNGSSNIKVDWLVIAYHKDYEPKENVVEDNINDALVDVVLDEGDTELSEDEILPEGDADSDTEDDMSVDEAQTGYEDDTLIDDVEPVVDDALDVQEDVVSEPDLSNQDAKPQLDKDSEAFVEEPSTVE
ncbi:hypothetical protein KJ766_00940 [Patescibacteria group bacterium]|nr:hypothetical protein [Patescibacteria group bacterium]